MAAIHFQDRQVSLIHNLVSNTLGFSVQVGGCPCIRGGFRGGLRFLEVSQALKFFKRVIKAIFIPMKEEVTSTTLCSDCQP